MKTIKDEELEKKRMRNETNGAQSNGHANGHQADSEEDEEMYPGEIERASDDVDDEEF